MKRLNVLIGSLAAIGCVLVGSFALGETFNAGYYSTSPVIDGSQGAGEWSSAYSVTFDRRDGGGDQHGCNLYLQHDATYLFVGVDSQWGSGWDVVWDVRIDGDHNGELNGSLSSPYLDVCNCRPSPTGYPGYTAYYVLESDLVETSVGFGSGAASASSGSENVFYEFRIPLADLDATPGDSVGVHIDFGYDGVTEHRYLLSGAGESLTPEDWATLNLQVPEPSTFALFTAFGISLFVYVWRRRKRAA